MRSASTSRSSSEADCFSAIVDDTSDIRIPSTFVSRASYLSLLQSWADEQPSESDGEPVGLLVIMSKDELFAW